MADVDIPFPSTLGKLETQTLGGSVIFLYDQYLQNGDTFSMADTDIPFPSTLRKLGHDANFLLIQSSEFSFGSVLPLTHPKFVSMFKTFMCGHLCMVTFLHLIQESAKKIPPR